MVVSRLFGLFSTDMAIDLGTSTTRLCVRGRGLVSEEPTVLAVKKGTHEVLDDGRAIGRNARKMLGRAPLSIDVIRPLRGGSIDDFDMTRILLAHFIRTARNGSWIAPRLLVNASTDLSDVAKTALQQAADRAGAGKVYLLDQPRAAGLGAGQPIHEAHGHMIIDIGAGTTDISVLSLGDVVESRSIPVAGDAMDEAITHYVRNRYNILIGPDTAEDVKIRLGSALPGDEGPPLEITGYGRDVQVPRSVVLGTDEVQRALDRPLSIIIDSIGDLVARLGPELSSDLMESGITLCGGVASLPGLADRIYASTNTKVHVPQEPGLTVARGLELVLKYFDEFRPFLECPEDRI